MYISLALPFQVDDQKKNVYRSVRLNMFQLIDECHHYLCQFQLKNGILSHMEDDHIVTDSGPHLLSGWCRNILEGVLGEN